MMIKYKWFIIFMLVLSILITSVSAGTQSVGTCAELSSALTNNLTDTIQLTGDINCTGHGLFSRADDTFSGDFYGNNYTITGLRINDTRASLFHQIDNAGLHNFIIEDFVGYATVSSYSGIVVGYGLDGSSTIDQIAVKNSYMKNLAGSYTGGIVGQWEAGAGSDMTNVYAVNVTIVSTGGQAGGIVGETGYTGDIMYSYAANCSINATSKPGGFIGDDAGDYAGQTIESFTYNMLTNGTITHQFTGDPLTHASENYFYGLLPAGGSDTNATEINQVGYFTNTTKGNYDPMDTWDTGIWHLTSEGLPKFVWEYVPTDNPPTWSNNITNATDPIYLGTAVQSWVYLQDDTEVSAFICSWNATAGTWANGTATIAGATPYNASCTGTIPTTPGDKTIGYMEFFNDSANQWNTTDIFIYEITDRYPNYGCRSDNITSPWFGGPVRFFSDWYDDGWLNDSAYGYFLLYNSTTLMTNSTPARYDTPNFATGGWSANYYRHDFNLNVTGIYSWGECVNDSNNQWTCSELKNFTIIGANPHWYGYGSNATDDTIVLGGATVLYSNWTLTAGSLTNFKLLEKLPNGTWYAYNNTGWSNFVVCSNVTDCAAEVLSNRSMSPVGIHTFVFEANSSSFGTNYTPAFDIYVNETYPQWINTTQNTSTIFLGSHLTVTGNFSDSYNLSGTIFTYWNTTHWVNTTWSGAWTYTEDYGYTGTIKSAKIQGIFSSSNVVGDWQWKYFVNNSLNNWNVTEIRSYSVVNQYPQWYDQRMKQGSVYNTTSLANGSDIDYALWNSIWLVANWSTYSNMSHFITQIYNTTHWFNSTDRPFSSYTCARDFNESCLAHWKFPSSAPDYIKGNWSWKMFANNTRNEWNVTPLLTLNFKTIPDGAAALNTYNVTPCFYLNYVRQNWKIGTYVNMTVWVNDTQPYGDPTPDTVMANFIINENSTNASATICESGWSSWSTKNTPIRLNISNCLNWTTTKMFWVLQMNDSQNGTIINYSEYTGVNYAGREGGECTTIYGYVVSAPPVIDNSSLLQSAFESAREAANLGKNIFWMFIMLLTVIAIWFPAQGYKAPKIAFMGTIGALVLEAFMGLQMEFIGTGTFMVTFILCIIASGIAIKQAIK